MAEMVTSAIVQEAVSIGVSFLLGKRKEMNMSQGHIMERLEMAVIELELAVERSARLRITDVSLLGRRKIIKRVYVEAMEQFDRHKPQAGSAGQQQVAQRVKRPRWMFWSKDPPSAAGLSMDDVRRFEWYADCARKFVLDVESGCSLHHNKFCNPIVWHLLEGKTVKYFYLDQRNLLRYFVVWPTYSDERGLEAVLACYYGDNTIFSEGTYGDSTAMTEKSFTLALFLRLSESTDIFGDAIKGLQSLTTSGLFKLAAECAIGELTMLCNLQDIAHSYRPPWVGIEEYGIKCTTFRPDPTCCKGSRHGLCANNIVSSQLSHMFPEHVTWCFFECYYVQAIEPIRSSSSSFDMVGRSKSRGSRKQQPMVLIAMFGPHDAIDKQESYAAEIVGDFQKYRGASIHQVAEKLTSDTINCFFRQPELTWLTDYKIGWFSKHGRALFCVQKENIKRTGAPKTRRRYNTRGSTRSGRK